MIIDIHTHIAFSKIYPLTYLTGMLESESLPAKGQKLNALLGMLLRDRHCDRMIQQMNEAGIAKAVLLVIDGGIGMGEPELSLEQIYLLHQEVLEKYPERFIVFGGVDPRRGRAGIALFKRSVLEYNFKGLKLYPPMGYPVTDKGIYSLLQFCEEQSLPVLIHTGPSLPSLQNEFAELANMSQVARDFPGVKFILAHAGVNLSHSAIHGLLSFENVYFDIAGFQGAFLKGYVTAQDKLKMIFHDDFNSRVLYGSDWPLFNTMSTINQHLDCLRNLFHGGDSTWSDEKLSNIMYKNARKILGVI
jgi:uncharacterized protein